MNLQIIWNQENYQEFIKYLESLQDVKYQQFQIKITECDKLIGIKTSKLKEIAKVISQNDYQSFLQVNTSPFYEPIMIEGFIYGNLKISFSLLTTYLDAYLLKVTNWAHVDLLVSSLKAFKRNQKEGFLYAKKLIRAKNLWMKRCGIVILLTYYMNDSYIDKVLDLASKVKTKDYYVKMALAWLFSIAYIKYKEKTLLYIINLEDDYIYNKTLSKIIESRRILKEEKDFIKSLKREIPKEKIG